MTQSKEFFTRIQHKHDIEANWIKAVNFTPLAGEIIVYDKDDTHNYTRVKIGDGTTKINNLPFTLPTASSSTLGGVKIGSNISVSSGTISLTKSNVTGALGYTPPTQDTTYSTFVKSGSGAAAGLVPKPSTTAGTTKYLREDGTWQVPPDNNTTYTFATGDSNGQIKITPSGGSAQNISVKGLGTAAYTASTAYATSAQGTKADNAMPKSGGTFTGLVTLNADPTAKLHAATKQYVDAVNTTASNAMPKSGGTFTGNVKAYETARTTRGIFNEETRSSNTSGTLQSVKYFINVI